MKFSKIFLAALLACIVGAIITSLIKLMVLFGLIGSASLGSTVEIKPNSVLKIDLAQPIIDAPNSDPLSSINIMTLEMEQPISLLSALKAIETAADDDNIEGIYLRIDPMSVCSTATLEELRSALERFKESGKFIIAHNDTYTQGAYYLSSVADQVYAQPEGMILLQGLSSQTPFFKGLLDKLDITVEVFRPTVCKYKSAVEPFILDKMSPANRKQMQELIDSMWGIIASQIAQSRSIDVDYLNTIVDQLGCLDPSDALEAGIVDGLLYKDEVYDLLAEKGVEIGDEPHIVEFSDYVMQAVLTENGFGAPKIGIIYAEGEIVDGSGYDAKIYGDITAASIRRARLDDDIEAVVLRVNSPGGSALASNVMWRELELLREVKPLIVSMGAYAASGGYYISAPADVIIANNLTLTGSIGVYGMIPDIDKALKNKLGVTMDGVESNANSSFMTSLSGMNNYEKSVMLKSVDKVYECFTNIVAEGRNLPIDDVLEIAQGRVWSGATAVEIGLVDSIGGIRDAIATAAFKAGIEDNFRIVEVLEEPTGFAALISSLSAKVKVKIMESHSIAELETVYRDYSEIRKALSPIMTEHGLVMYSPYRIEL